VSGGGSSVPNPGIIGGGFGVNDGADSGKYTIEQMRRARELLTRIHAVRRAARFYDFGHPSVDAAVGALDGVLRSYHAEHVDVQLVFLDGEVLLGEQLLTEESVAFDQLIRELIAAGIEGAVRAELTRAMRIVSSDSAAIEQAGGIETMTAEARLSHVEIGLVGIIEAGQGERFELSEDVRMAFGNAVSVIKEIQSAFAGGKPIQAKHVAGVTKSLVDNVLSSRDAMLQMTALKNHTEYTYYHSANVAILSVSLASTISRDPRFLSSLGSGALLHDIGKLEVGLDIIEKPGRLDADEWDKMRQHPLLGAQMASQMPGVDSAVLVPILEHHMAWDGSGYPSRTPRRKQHLSSRIVAVADSYDAMTSKRSYSVARVQDQAMKLIVESSGTSLDPALVKLFLRMMGAYPPRSVVLLSDGSVAIVVAPSEQDAYRPTVRILTDPSGKFITPADVALTERPGLTITGLIDSRRLNINIDDYL
jgi:putative nucleotidyltransferase with HDIG domain